MKVYYFATSNSCKFKEVKEILHEIRPDITILQKFIDIEEIQGNAQEISLHKTMTIIKKFDYLDNVFTEDISLYCEGLHGMPGPYIKDALKDMGLKKLSKLAILSENNIAKATCCYTLYSKNQYTTISRTISGSIVEPRGNNAFGFDSIFEVGTKTFAEMGSNEKNKISHRRLSLEALSNLL